MRYEDTFWRMLRHEEFDASEMSLSSFLMAKAQGKPDFVALPVFLSRVFRHSSIYVNADAGVERPADLRGKVVGVPEYQMTAALWIRGILQHEYGVAPHEMRWRNGGLEEPGREEKLPLYLPPNLELEWIGPERTLGAMLLAGEIAAVVTARPPAAFVRRDPRVRRLFPDYKRVEIEYYRKTGIFPPMHLVVLKRRLYEDHPWVATSLYQALCEAKAYCGLHNMFDGHLRYALPTLHAAVEEAAEAFGEADMWPYGVDANRHTIETALQYSYEQGLTPRRLALEELFAPNVLDSSRN
jgi:4,5-dihydroxyphthalate decarboxylase